MPDVHDLITEEGRPSIRDRLKGVPRAAPHEVIVLKWRDGNLTTMTDKERLTLGQYLWGGVESFHRVDCSMRTIDFGGWTLPCSRGAHEYLARGTIAYMVTRPAGVVTRNIRNVRSFVESSARAVLTEASRSYDVRDIALAQRELRESLREHEVQRVVKVKDFTLLLSVDESTQALIDERNRHELELLRSRQDRELKQADLEFYSPLLQGDWRGFAVALLDKKNDPGRLVDLMRSEHHLDFQRSLQSLKVLVETDAIEQIDIEEEAKKALQQFVANNSQPIGLPEHASLGGLQSSSEDRGSQDRSADDRHAEAESGDEAPARTKAGSESAKADKPNRHEGDKESEAS